MSTIIHVNDLPRFPDAVYIGRAVPRRKLAANPLANPFSLAMNDRRTALVKYHEHLMKGLRDGSLTEALIAVRGKPLACWCRHDGVATTETNRCHGDLILGVLAVFTDGDLRAMANGADRHCRVCGCTDDDCSGCIERTGIPCSWVEADLCSACVEVLR